jgi:hypothetical protein
LPFIPVVPVIAFRQRTHKLLYLLDLTRFVPAAHDRPSVTNGKPVPLVPYRRPFVGGYWRKENSPNNLWLI